MDRNSYIRLAGPRSCPDHWWWTRPASKAIIIFELDYAPEDGQRMPPAGAPDTDGAPLLTAVQLQLGLKLEAKKGAVQLVVVDHIEKAPTEN